MGLRMRRFKTGTPPRVNRRSIDVSGMELQPGDEDPVPFSFRTGHAPENRAVCYLTYTNAHTHEIIRENHDRSPLFNGLIESVGPRYCPSIETKIDRFPTRRSFCRRSNAKKSPASTARGSSTARAAMRRPPCRALSRA